MGLFIATERQKKSRILDWAELCELTKDSVRCRPADERVADECFERVTRAYGDKHVAQLDDRTFAIARNDHIAIAHVKTFKSGSHREGQTRLIDCAKVYAAQNGATQYYVSLGIPAVVANRWLPIPREELVSRSSYRETRGAFGSAGVYQRGTTEIYHNAGPDFMHPTTGSVLAMIAAASWPDDFRAAASEFVVRIADSMSSFANVILRIEAPRDEEYADALAMAPAEGRCDWIRPRLSLAATLYVPGGYAEATVACGFAVPGAPHVLYHIVDSDRSSTGRLCDGTLLATADEVLAAAAEYAADHVYVPA